MPKKSVTVPAPLIEVRWRSVPAKHDYPAAANYLGLIADPKTVKSLVSDLQKQPVVHYRANDILRAARLALLPLEDPSVRRDLGKLTAGESWAPVLMIRGDMLHDFPLTIADGYHRVCASYHLSEDTPVPCQIVDLPVHERLSGS
jgi:hypothetical protein